MHLDGFSPSVFPRAAGGQDAWMPLQDAIAPQLLAGEKEICRGTERRHHVLNPNRLATPGAITWLPKGEEMEQSCTLG